MQPAIDARSAPLLAGEFLSEAPVDIARRSVADVDHEQVRQF
jgi:hypothetical protein